ncbi:Hint domain-containing protein, partial [Actinoplanes sp. G11-F43]|uniref:Hint domain-containing protein n=1 Tax=Actinoplanes sp. G11-F43 TaxID=3424130 RepID=UPI003D32711E
ARATEALEAARLAGEAAVRAERHVKFAYEEAAKAATSAADAAQSAAEAKQAAAQAAAEGAAARLAAANAARHDAQARADAAAARAAANAAASDANAAGRSAQDAQDDADRAGQAATAAEADAAAAHQAATAAEADAASARRAADSAQQHVEGAAQAASDALQHAADAQRAADRAEEAERQRQAQAIADAAAGATLDPLDPDLLQYLTPEQQAELRQAHADAGLSVLDFLQAEAADLLYELSGAGDLVRCFRDGNVEACLWSLAGLIGGIKAVRAGYKIVKALPKIINFLKKIKNAENRRHLLLELARRLKKESRGADSCDEDDRKNSFLPGTPVLLADGGTRPIEELRIGDMVAATDPLTGSTSARPVTATIIGDGDKKLIDITIDTDGDRGAETAMVTATHNHPFWVPALSAWVDAERLSPQQWLRTGDGTHVQISAIGHRAANTRVHNVTVAEIHTYYVMAGETPVLVHNANCKRKVYRQLSYDDRVRFDKRQGLEPHGTGGSIIDHIAGRPTKHISASLTEGASERFASGQGMVEIDIDKAIAGGARYIDHNNVMQAAKRSRDSKVVRDARRAEEVLFVGLIPYDAMKPMWKG